MRAVVVVIGRVRVCDCVYLHGGPFDVQQNSICKRIMLQFVSVLYLLYCAFVWVGH